MHTDTHRLADQHLLMDAARRHAAQLRADAIDEFWSSAGDAAFLVLAGDVFDGNRETGGIGRDARVARRGMQFGEPRRSRERQRGPASDPAHDRVRAAGRGPHTTRRSAR